MTEEPDTFVSWLNDRPYTLAYIAIVTTAILVVQLIDLLKEVF